LKTLYNILGVDSDSTVEQIERAYSNYYSKLQSGTADLSPEEVNNQLVAIREARTTLTNPILRQRYDQKISASSLQYAETGSSYSYDVARGSVFGTKTIILFGIIILAGVYLYTSNAKEREQLRIAHEHEVQMKAVQIAEERQKQEAKIQNLNLDRSASQSQAEQLRMSQQQFERELAQRQQLDLQRQQMEMQQQQRQEQQEQQRRQQQLQSDKRMLQQMERDRYGKVITY
jgi:curved DNA-binding protein CbpA